MLSLMSAKPPESSKARPSVGRAEEFEALIHGPNTTLDVIKWTQRNVSLIARALRRDAEIENTSAETLLQIKYETGEREPLVHAPAVLAAFREAIQ